MTYAELEANFARWAQAQPEVRAALVIGSRARSDHPADEWSDLDLVVFTTDAEIFAADPGWLNALGEVWLPVLSRLNTGGDPEWLVLFADMVKGDFAFTTSPPGASSLSEMAAAFPYPDVFARGARVLVDKTGAPAGDLSLPETPSPALPTPREFQEAIHKYLYGIVRAAKLLGRGDLWRAKFQCDCELKQGLLEMLEWHARLTSGAQQDTWHEGRFMDEWAGPQTLAALPSTFAVYNPESVWDALDASLELYRALAQESAARLGTEYPQLIDRRVSTWLEKIRPAG